jgi:hemerythrin
MDGRPRFDSRFSVGIDQVDREHQKLFEIAGRVHDCLMADGESAVAAARRAVAELIDYTETHFASEEGLMAGAGYPELDSHRILHRNLMAQARDMELRVELGERNAPLELNRFVCNWLIDHIQDHDKRFGAFATAQE